MNEVYFDIKYLIGFLAIITANDLQLPEVGDFEALHCQSSRNFGSSTKLDLTTEPPLLGRCCWWLVFYLFVLSCKPLCMFS